MPGKSNRLFKLKTAVLSVILIGVCAIPTGIDTPARESHPLVREFYQLQRAKQGLNIQERHRLEWWQIGIVNQLEGDPDPEAQKLLSIWSSIF